MGGVLDLTGMALTDEGTFLGPKNVDERSRVGCSSVAAISVLSTLEMEKERRRLFERLHGSSLDSNAKVVREVRFLLAFAGWSSVALGEPSPRV